jgi:hypothetical protein
MELILTFPIIIFKKIKKRKQKNKLVPYLSNKEVNMNLPATRSNSGPPQKLFDEEDAQVVKSVIERSKNTKEMVNGLTKLYILKKPELLPVLAEINRRDNGIKICTGLTVLTIGGSIVLLTLGGPLSIGAALFCLGVTNMGALIALISGKQISMKEFIDSYTDVLKSQGASHEQE